MDFDASSQSFLQWFLSQSGATFHPSLRFADLRSRDAGRGIIAHEDIPADTELFNIPRKSVISVENSSLSKLAPQILTTLNTQNGNADADDEDIDLPNPWLDLILVLIYEYLQGSSSTWRDYFNVLPTEFDTLMFWSPSELSHLQASAVISKIGKDSAEELFRSEVIPSIRSHSSIFFPPNQPVPSDDDLIALSHGMGSLIMAYAFDLSSSDAPSPPASDDDEQDGWAIDTSTPSQMGMVPVADMLNSDAEFNAHLNHGDDALTMTSLRPIVKGEEVLNYYGPLPNCDLLRRYGYVSAKHARYDVVEISWEKIRACIVQRWSARENLAKIEKVEREMGEDLEEAFIVEREAGEPDESGRLVVEPRLRNLGEELEEQVSAVVAPLVGVDVSRGKPAKEDRTRLRIACLEIMEVVLQRREAEYETSVEEDQAILERDASGFGRRERMAVSVRLGEKLLLREAQSFVKMKLESLRAEQAEAKNERPAKKQRTR